jgi:glycine/sarcosine N-methyltransferase
MFYKSIANVYDYIFPQNRKQLEFIESISLIETNDSILDIGCATGNLSELLSEKSNFVTGIELDEDLISIAKRKSKSNNITYKHTNMLFLNEHFEDNSIDKIISFGNTLVHLPSRDNVKDFFNIVYSLLKKNGSFIVQIINYDRIINQNINNLATIDNDNIKFVRKYKYNENNGSVDFITELLIKKNNQLIRNNIQLLALKKDEIKKYLEKAKFKDVKFYGSLNVDGLTDDSVPLLFSGKK